MAIFFIAFYFLIGGIAVVFLNRKKKDSFQNRGLKIKYFVYLILVVFQLVLMYKGLYVFFAFLVVLAGGYELMQLPRSAIKIKILLFYAICSIGFGSFFAQESERTIMIFTLVIVLDGFSQIIGQLLGKKQIFPRVSPGKTREGLIGGVLVTSLTGVLFLLEEKNVGGRDFFTLFWVIGFAILGDFIASWIKRKHRIKDFGTLLPGHGGVLDRFDSLILVGFSGTVLQFISGLPSCFYYLLVYTFLFIVFFLVIEYLYQQFLIPVEYTRKAVHVFSGMIVLSFPYYFQEFYPVAVLSLSFLFFLKLTQKYQWLPSIHAVERKTSGSMWFPLAVMGCFYFSIAYHSKSFFILPILMLTWADATAALVGKKWPWGRYRFKSNFKTVTGSTAFWVVAFLIFLGYQYFVWEERSYKMIIWAVLGGLILTLVEALSQKGTDNISIPLATLLILIMNA